MTPPLRPEIRIKQLQFHRARHALCSFCTSTQDRPCLAERVSLIHSLRSLTSANYDHAGRTTSLHSSVPTVDMFDQPHRGSLLDR